MWQLLIPAITGIIDKIIPDPQAAADAKLKALDMAQRGELAELSAAVELAKGQMEINNVEAAQDVFRGGWRPAVGWVCVAAMAFQYLVRPLLIAFEIAPADLPGLDDNLWAILASILGIGGLRSFEKVKGIAAK